MNAVLLIDFGSTNTKVTAVDVENEVILGTATAYTTVQSDVNEGLENAMRELKEKLGSVEFSQRYACSSAAGGLRMVTSGLVPELTAQAAKLASLGAGAKVVGVYSYQLTEDDVADIDAQKPEIVLLTGGTDGGNTENILINAKMLTSCRSDFPVIIAGNRTCARECERILQGREVIITKNVMPRFNELCIEPAQQVIRDIFLRRIVQAKGLSKAKELISGILMPTPSAMLTAMQLLADGTKTESGIGEIFAVDLGGATTDVYSIAEGAPTQMNTIIKGLTEPRIKRTVEGDIGMRYSVHGIIDAAGVDEVARISGIPAQRCVELADFLSANTDYIPDDAEHTAFDFALASLAVRTACIRHAGTIEQVFTPMGLAFAQTGKDLKSVKNIVATGGALIHNARTGEIAKEALFSEKAPSSLRPERAEVLIDKKYILAAMGLLSEKYPDVALRIMKKELCHNGNQE